MIILTYKCHKSCKLQPNTVGWSSTALIPLRHSLAGKN